MHDGIQSYGSLGVLSKRSVCFSTSGLYLAGHGWFRGPHCFLFFPFFMFGSALEGKLRIIGGTLACISVFEIGDTWSTCV
jgi:hypothetical protein